MTDLITPELVVLDLAATDKADATRQLAQKLGVSKSGLIRGGIGSMIAEALGAAEVDTPVRRLGVPGYFPKHGSRGEVLEEFGLSPGLIAASITEWVDNLTD